MNKKQLKKMDCKFRCHASTLVNSYHADFLLNLKLFVKYINETDILLQYIQSLPDTGNGIEEAFPEVIQGHGRVIFLLGETDAERIVNTYKILNSPSLDENAIRHICLAYGLGCQHYQDMVKKFCQRVLLPFINHLQLYLTNIGIEMGMDDSVQYNITVNNGGQVNLSQDNSTLNAVQNNNGIDFNHMQTMIDDILSVAKEHHVSDKDLQQITESLDFIKEELQKPSPKKTAVRLILDGLLSTASVLGTIPTIVAKINDFSQYIAPLLN